MQDRRLLDAIPRLAAGMSGWELEFVESIRLWLGRGKPLTDRQRAVLRKIARRTA